MRKNSETMTNELVGIAVAKLRNKLHRLMKQRYMAEAEIQITVEEFMLLSMIEEKTDQILQSIALATGKNKSVVMRMIDSLERKGLARRTVNPDDRRENLLSITAEGREGRCPFPGYRPSAYRGTLRRYPRREDNSFLRGCRRTVEAGGSR